jgi:hypothetical protein
MMMNFLAKTVVHRADVRQRLRDELLVIGDTSPHLGRKKHTLLGTERVQLDILVGVRVIDAYLQELEEQRAVVDPDLRMYVETTKGKRLFAAQLLGGLSTFSPHIVPNSPIQSLYKSLGPLIRMRKTEPGKRGDGGRYWYINKDGATSMEVLAAFNTHRLKAQSDTNRLNAQTDVWTPAIEIFPSDMTLMEAYAAEASEGLGKR